MDTPTRVIIRKIDDDIKMKNFKIINRVIGGVTYNSAFWNFKIVNIGGLTYVIPFKIK